jgi:hypothetical protein
LELGSIAQKLFLTPAAFFDKTALSRSHYLARNLKSIYFLACDTEEHSPIAGEKLQNESYASAGAAPVGELFRSCR